jgi:putative membrane protein
MADTPYSRFEKDELILRDELAVDRTLLANERTLLAYLRSTVALLIAGVSIMHFAQQGWFWTVGIICLPTGIVTGVVGSLRFRKMNRSIAVVRKRQESSAEQSAAPLPSAPRTGPSEGAR